MPEHLVGNVRDELLLRVITAMADDQLNGQLALDQLVDTNKRVDSRDGVQRSPQLICRQRVVDDVLRSLVPKSI
ncbi:hypothetical protein D3C72_2555520 [compost metagenome]